jgi:hypothetical protein
MARINEWVIVRNGSFEVHGIRARRFLQRQIVSGARRFEHRQIPIRVSIVSMKEIGLTRRPRLQGQE